MCYSLPVLVYKLLVNIIYIHYYDQIGLLYFAYNRLLHIDNLSTGAVDVMYYLLICKNKHM